MVNIVAPSELAFKSRVNTDARFRQAETQIALDTAQQRRGTLIGVGETPAMSIAATSTPKSTGIWKGLHLDIVR